VSTDNPAAVGRRERLDSWKAIAVHLGRDVRTVQRWEKSERLPVHRKLHDKLSSVYAYKSEIDAWWRDGGPGPAPEATVADSRPRRPLLAVLPLRNLNGHEEEEYFSDGLTEELISHLSRINPDQLGVISSSSTLRYKGNTNDLGRIVRELRVSYILDGSVRRSANRVRVAVQLIGVGDHGHLWADSYDHDLRDILELQAEVAKDVAAQIAVKLSAREEERLTHARPIAASAYEAYLRGRFFWNQRNPEAIGRAIEFFKRAISSDPNYACAHSGLADCYSMLSSTALGALNPALAMPRSKTAAERALQLDSRLAEAHASLAYIRLFYDWDWVSAESSLRQALELNASYATGRQWFAEYLTTLGRFDEATVELRRAQELDPLSLVIRQALASVHYLARDYDRAIEECRETLKIDPAFVLAYLNLGRACVQKRRYREAIAALKTALELLPGASAVLMGLGRAFAASGNKSEARKIINALKRLARRHYVPAFHFAVIYAALDDHESTFAWLRKAREERCDYFVYLDREPGSDGIRLDPEFIALVPQAPRHLAAAADSPAGSEKVSARRLASVASRKVGAGKLSATKRGKVRQTKT
jgi:TolB-like protein/Tfp pilus assembly protein PilF